MKAFKIKALVFAAALAGSAGAMAATATADMTNTATVTASCVISAQGFSTTYDPVGANKTAAQTVDTAYVKYTCTNGGTGARIALNEGTHPDSGSTPQAPARRLFDGSANYLNYSLYSDASHTTWGSGSDTVTVPAIQDGGEHTNIVYAAILGGQNVPVGTYTDTVTATITF